MTKFIRKLFLTTPAGVFSELKIEFDVLKTLTGEPNDATIAIYNVSAINRLALNQEGLEITLIAGYRDEANYGIIFKGFTRDTIHERLGPDIKTTITAGDGDKSQREGYTSRTFPKNTSVESMVRDIHGDMKGVELGELKFPDDMPVPTRPMSFMSPPQRALDELGRSFGFFWSVQNGALEVVPGDKALSDTTFITPRTGMIGVPSITDSGIVVTTLLDPSIRPGRKIMVQSETTDFHGKSGEYRVSSVRYYGNNRDGDFVCEVEGELLQGEKTKVK